MRSLSNLLRKPKDLRPVKRKPKKRWISEGYWIGFVSRLLKETPELQKSFEWLKSEKNRKYKLDAYFPKHNLVLEYNGAQHYRYVRYFHRKNKNGHLTQMARDQHKYSMLKANLVNLLVIRFDDTEVMVIENLKRILGISA